MKHIWDDVLTDKDKEIFTAAGYGNRAGFGKRPVLMIIDVNYNFVGDKPEPIMESIKRWRNSCGEEGWVAVNHTRRLIEAARKSRIPIIYSTGQDPRPDGFDSGRWADKNSRRKEDANHAVANQLRGNDIVAAIAPEPQDIVISKAKPSVFFGTMLTGYLTDLQADSVICCGTTTSGCVRATVLDGFSYNFRMSVVEECTFDRSDTSHKINLCDMHQKYADVVKLDEAVQFMESLTPGMFDDKLRSLART